MGTGSLTHNLGEFRNPTTTEAWPYVAEFTAWVRQQANKNDKDALCRYRELAPHAKRAHPTEEHLLPLFFALGATLASDHFEVLTTEVRYGMLSMESYAWH
jgi:4,5-DOPA dioxygenase extradiol